MRERIKLILVLIFGYSVLCLTVMFVIISNIHLFQWHQVETTLPDCSTVIEVCDLAITAIFTDLLLFWLIIRAKFFDK